IDPYKIWLSEIILQQTRVAQGLPYYSKFIKRFPSIEDLAVAPEEEVLRLWQGLGYYSRARNLHACAKSIVQTYGGKFPEDHGQLLKLKGVGPYTAAAIASFAFKIPTPVFDGNVFRVLSRYFGLYHDISTNTGRQSFAELGSKLISQERPDDYNQAIMEFGALHCTPLHPNCQHCVFSTDCFAFQNGEQKQLPVKSKKVKVTHRYFNYFVIHHSEGLFMKSRKAKDIWQGLYDFHLLETSEGQDTSKVMEQALVYKKEQPKVALSYESKLYRHKLTHQHIHARFFHLELGDEVAIDDLLVRFELNWYSHEQVQDLPKPILIDNYLKDAIF
ncbi:MAG: A/G-specific adenine glycosylase, partial [Cyclobacteriaceae bacterium]